MPSGRNGLFSELELLWTGVELSGVNSTLQVESWLVRVNRSGLFLVAGLVVLVACGGPGGVEDGAPGGGARVVDLVEEDRETTLDSVPADRDRGFDPLVTPSVSGIDLGRLQEVVELLEDPAGCPPVVAVPSWDDVVEVLRLVDGCLVLEYESLGGRSVQDVAEGFGPASEVLAVGRPLRVAIDNSHWRDPEAANQWHLETLGAEDLWAGWPAGADVLVAVVDTGVDGNHRDLDDNLIWWGDEGHRDDVESHGTHVAGIIAAEEGNGIAGAGVAPRASIVSLSVHVFDSELGGGVGANEGWFLSLAGAVAEARQAGAKVVNLSIKVLDDNGRVADSLPVWCDDEAALYCADPAEWQIRTGQAEGMIFVAAGGNCGPQGEHSAPAGKDPPCKYLNQVQYPAAYEGVIAVASTDDHDQWSEFSTVAPHMDIAAPGENLLSTLPRNTFGKFRWNRERTGDKSGTSMAAPVVSAVIAHLIARFPDATHQEITDALYQTARNVDLFGNPLSGRTNELGWGIIQPLDAIQHLHNSRTPPTTAPPTTTTVTTTIAAPTTTAAQTTTAAPATTASARLGRIAYTSNRDGDYEIYIHNLDTGENEQITDNTHDDRSPDWSPDGTRIAYSSDRDGDFEIYIHNIDTGENEQITDNGNRNWDNRGNGAPDWSPDGTRIAYHNGSLLDVDIYIYDLDTRENEQIIGYGNWGEWLNRAPDWSPDGTRIAYRGTTLGDVDIYIYDLDTRENEQITHNTHDNEFPVWSPDGIRIAYTSDRDGDWEIYVRNLETGENEQITDNTHDDGFPVWSPDGIRIAYTSDRDGDWEIYVRNLETGQEEQITDNTHQDWASSWSV